MSPQPVLMRLSAQISRAQRGHRVWAVSLLSFYFHFLFAISMLTSQTLLRMAFIFTMEINTFICVLNNQHQICDYYNSV